MMAFILISSILRSLPSKSWALRENTYIFILLLFKIIFYKVSDNLFRCNSFVNLEYSVNIAGWSAKLDPITEDESLRISLALRLIDWSIYLFITWRI